MQTPKGNREAPSSQGASLHEHDIIRRLCHALTTAERVIGQLAPHGYTDPTEPSYNVQAEKVISETGLLLVAASRASHHPEVRKLVDHVITLLIPYARSDRMRLGICMEPSLALDFAQAHACLTALGHPDARFDQLLDQSLRSNAAHAKEREPHRVLEQHWTLELLGKSHPQDMPIARQSILATSLDLLHCNRENIYAFTHAMMFAKYRNQPLQLPRPRATILAETEATLAWCLDEQDYDVGGEVLLSWPLTGRAWSATATFGYRILTNVEDQAGFLPSPATNLAHLDSLTGAARSNYLLASAYHTMYVMGLLSAAALQPDTLPPRKITAPKAIRGSAAPFIAILHDSKHQPHWYETFEQLGVTEQDALMPLLFAITLQRATKQHAFDAVLRILDMGQEYKLTDTPIAAQATDMLERLALFANPYSKPKREASTTCVQNCSIDDAE